MALNDLNKLRTAAERTPPILILNVTQQPYLSIARFYGGCKAFGAEYVYIHPQDALIHSKYMKEFNKQMNAKKTWEDFIEWVKAQPATIN